MLSAASSNALLSVADDRDYPAAAWLNPIDEIPEEYSVWQPDKIESQTAGHCTSQSVINIMECLIHQRLLWGLDEAIAATDTSEIERLMLEIAKQSDCSVGYNYGTPLNDRVEPGIEPRVALKSVLHEGTLMAADWECYDENPQCREKRTSLPDAVLNKAQKYIQAYVRISTKEEMQRYMLQYGLPVLAVAPTKYFGWGSGYHAVAVYGWVTQETAKREFIYAEDRDLRYTNSWGAWNARALIAWDMITEMWGVIPAKIKGDETMRGVEHLHPELQNICREFVKRCKAEGLNVKITDTLRSKAEQDALYAQGRTEPGSIVTNVRYPESAHNWGVAFDICRNEKGRQYDDSDGFFAKCGAIGRQLGLTWGGDWQRFEDKPHFEWKKFMPNNSVRWLMKVYGTPEKFKEEWEEEELTPEKLAEMLPEAFAILAEKGASEWAKPALEWAKENGIMVGDQYGNQMPQKPITREEVAQMFFNLGKK